MQKPAKLSTRSSWDLSSSGRQAIITYEKSWTACSIDNSPTEKGLETRQIFPGMTSLPGIRACYGWRISI